MLLATLRLRSGKEALKDGFQSGQSIHDAQLDRFQLQAPFRQIAEQTGPQIGSFAISHLQSQNFEAFVFFTHAQHGTEALPAHVAVNAHQKVGPVHIKKLVGLALQRTTSPGFQLRRSPAPRCARSAWSRTYAPGASPRSAPDPGSTVPPEKLPLRRLPTPDPALSSPAATAR